MWTVIVKFDYVTFSLVWDRSQWRSQGAQGARAPQSHVGGRHIAGILRFFCIFFLQKISVLSYLANEVAEIRGEY